MIQPLLKFIVCVYCPTCLEILIPRDTFISSLRGSCTWMHVWQSDRPDTLWPRDGGTGFECTCFFDWLWEDELDGKTLRHDTAYYRGHLA